MYNKFIELIENSNYNLNEQTELKKYLNALEDDSYKLNCLECNGVDNWEWYSEALEDYYERKED